MKIHISHYLWVSVIVLFSCTGKPKLTGDLSDFEPLTFLDPIEQLNDTTFFSDNVFHLTIYGDTLAMADAKQACLIFCTKEGELLGSIGRKGEGPNEFVNLRQFVRLDDSSFVMTDSHTKRIKLIKNGKFSRNLADEVALLETRMCHLNDALFFYGKNDAGRLCRMDIKTDSVACWGEAQDFKFKDITALRNQRHVVTDGKYLYAARVDRPIVEKYSPEGELVQTLDLSYMPIFKQIIEQDAVASAGSWPNIGIDLYPANGKLYYLVGYQIDEAHRGSDKLIVISADGPKMEVESLHSLSDGWYYSTLAVSGDELFAFEWAQGVMHKYKL